MYQTWESVLAAILTYVPFTALFLYAFHNNLRFSVKTTVFILLSSTVLRVGLIEWARHTSSKAVILYNYFDIFILLFFAISTVKSRVGRMAFVGLVLKNTADTIVILAKFLEHLVNPDWGDMGYHWTYSVSIMVCEIIFLPFVFLVFRRYFTHEIRESISKRWRILWIVPFFFYLTWFYVFYFSSEKTDLELACLPSNSIFLFCSINCQYLIYICIATLVETLQEEARLVDENHAIQLQTIQYDHIHELISEDRKLRHDLRHHFTTISSLVEEERYDELSQYVASYISPVLWRSQIHYCSNTVMNLMATYHANKCAENQIDCRIVLNIPADLPLPNTEITILFGNLLENAFEACMEIPEDQFREIIFKGKEVNGKLLFSIENTYKKEALQQKKGEFISTKHREPGIGISSCKDIIEKHHGTIDFIVEDMFRVNIILNRVK